MKTIDDKIKERFRKIKLFSKCCDDSFQFSFSVKIVQNWCVASTYFCKPEWEGITLKASNQLSEFLHQNYRDQYRDWNDYASDGRKFIEAEFSNLIELWRTINNLNYVFVDCVKWDLLHSLIFQQYKVGLNGELPNFYENILIIYELGHFPCGFEGDYLCGTPVVI